MTGILCSKWVLFACTVVSARGSLFRGKMGETLTPLDRLQPFDNVPLDIFHCVTVLAGK